MQFSSSQARASCLTFGGHGDGAFASSKDWTGSTGFSASVGRALRYHVRAEYGNAMLSLIRSRFADRVIYQSQFIRGWWENWHGIAKAPANVIINGVDLNMYSPDGDT